MNLSKLIRRTHLFLALFLTPWVLIYAISTFAMHHRSWFTGEERRVDPGYELIREDTYTASFATDDDRQDIARRILTDLDLEGAFFVRGNLEDGALTITRDRPIGSYRITYEAEPGTIRVERQRFAMVYFLEMMHRRRGFQQPFIANDIYAVIVDGVIVAILLWAATGLWMWWEMIRTRKPGAWSLAAGIAFFLLFLLIL